MTRLRLVDLELTDPWRSADRAAAPDPGYAAARVLVRHRGRPVGALDLALPDGRMTEALVAEVTERFNEGFEPSAVGDEPSADEIPVTVVIATHDRADALRRCLLSVQASSHPGLRVVVVDNAPSSDAAAELVGREFPDVVYVRDDVPGLAQAHNTALEHVRTPVVAFTDDDVVVDARWVSALATPFLDERVACVTGLIWPMQLETEAQVRIETHGAFNKGFERRRFNLDESRPPDPLFPYTAGAFGSGANMAFRTRVLRELGGFDAALGAGSPGRGGDDLAAFFDVVTAGHTLVYEPAALVRHAHADQIEAVERQARNYGAGLSAYLTRVAVRRPAAVLDFLRLGPRAVRHVLRNERTPGGEEDGVRKRLLRLQLIGMAAGPVGYLHGAYGPRRRRSIRSRQQPPATPDDAGAAG